MCMCEKSQHSPRRQSPALGFSDPELVSFPHVLYLSKSLGQLAQAWGVSWDAGLSVLKQRKFQKTKTVSPPTSVGVFKHCLCLSIALEASHGQDALQSAERGECPLTAWTPSGEGIRAALLRGRAGAGASLTETGVSKAPLCTMRLLDASWQSPRPRK